KQIMYGLRYDFQGQRIACVSLNKLCSLVRGAGYTLFCQQLFARPNLKSCEAQSTYWSLVALKWREVPRLLPAGEQEAASVLGFSDPAQQTGVVLITRPHVAGPGDRVHTYTCARPHFF